MNTFQQMPPGYEKHLERATMDGIEPLTLERWEEVCREMDDMPGTLDLPEPEKSQTS